jgi:uncharacterized membrane protein YhaH (DUF805 family)
LFNAADVPAIDTCIDRQCFLTQALGRSQGTQVPSYSSASIHDGHATNLSLDKPSNIFDIKEKWRSKSSITVHWETFLTAYFDAMRRYFDFAGRSTRSQYWLFVLMFALLMIVATVLDGLAGNLEGDGPAFFLAVVNIAHLIPNLSVAVRRLHDTGRSGWWLLLSFIPIVGQIVLLVWLCSGSQPEANRFGGSGSTNASALAQRPATASQTHSVGADLDRLEKLAALKASGALSDEEYQRLKASTINTAGGQQ